MLNCRDKLEEVSAALATLPGKDAEHLMDCVDGCVLGVNDMIGRKGDRLLAMRTNAERERARREARRAQQNAPLPLPAPSNEEPSTPQPSAPPRRSLADPVAADASSQAGPEGPCASTEVPTLPIKDDPEMVDQITPK